MSRAAPTWRVRRMEGPPVVAVRVWLPGGSRAEEVPGQALISGRLLAEGTKNRDWKRIAEEAEALGCSLTTTAGNSVQALALDGLAADWECIVDWAAELALEAAFKEDRCAWLCRQAAAELESLSDLPEVVTEWAFLDQLFPDHPLGRPLLGSREGLESLDPEDCRSFHERCLSSGPLIAVAGLIDTQAVATRLEGLFRTSEKGVHRDSEVSEPEPPREERREIDLPPGDQAHLCVGTRTVRRSAPDYEAVRVLGVVLGSGSGLVGRIPQRIREVEGLAYTCEVSSVAGAGVDPGRLAIALSTSPGRLTQALAAVQEELERLRDAGVSRGEVLEARSYLSGREPFRRETASQWALLDLEEQLWGLPIANEAWCKQRIEEVSTREVREAARRYLDPAGLVSTIGLPT